MLKKGQAPETPGKNDLTNAEEEDKLFVLT